MTDVRHYRVRFVDDHVEVFRFVHHHTIADGVLSFWGPVTGLRADPIGACVLAQVQSWTLEGKP